MNEDTNIGYWEKVLQAPTPAYKELFTAEHDYLINEIPKDAHVLDVGCGEGRNMKSIFEVTPYVTGVDNDIAAVEKATNNFQGVATARVVRGEAKSLPFESESFDVVTVLMILPNLDQDKNTVLCEVARVLKSDGFVILSTFSEKAFAEKMKVYKQIDLPIEKTEGTRFQFKNGIVSEQFSLEEIKELANSAGLQVVSHKNVGQLAYICKLIKI